MVVGPPAAVVTSVPATLDGLFAAPGDPLILAVCAGTRLPPLTALVDWRLAGRLSRHIDRKSVV